MGFNRRKDISFSDFIDVRLLKPDGFKKEMIDSKFEVQTLLSKKPMVFEARSEVERHFWH